VIRDGTQITTLILSSDQVKETINALETASGVAESSRPFHDGMRYLKGNQVRIVSRIKLSLENCGEGVAIGGGPVGIAGELARREIQQVDKPFVKLAEMGPYAVQRNNDLKYIRIVGRCRRFSKPMKASFEGDLGACLGGA